jgi:hypothetical protein
MKQETMILEIQVLSYWHAGCGFGRGADVDALVLKDGNSLPYLPGRTVKGLLREAMQCCEDAGAVPEGTTSNLFGTPSREGDYAGSLPGVLSFGNAVLKKTEREWLTSREGSPTRAALYDAFASTSIDSASGIANDKTLRTIELCVPLILEAEIGGIPDNTEAEGHLKKAAVLLRALGAHRTRGLGRCRCTLRKRSERDAV